MWSYGGSEVAKDGKTITYNSKEVREALKFNKALYKDCMTPEVLAWDDASNNRLLASGRGSWIHNPISAYRTHRGPEQGAGGQDLRVALAQGAGVAALLRQLPRLRRHQVLQERGRAKAFLEALADNYREGAKASTGYNMPFLKNYAKPPFPIISEDPKLKPLEQDAEYHFTTGYPGPLTPAADEVYQQFIMVDALAQFAPTRWTSSRRSSGPRRRSRRSTRSSSSSTTVRRGEPATGRGRPGPESRLPRWSSCRS